MHFGVNRGVDFVEDVIVFGQIEKIITDSFSDKFKEKENRIQQNKDALFIGGVCRLSTVVLVAASYALTVWTNVNFYTFNYHCIEQTYVEVNTPIHETQIIEFEPKKLFNPFKADGSLSM